MEILYNPTAIFILLLLIALTPIGISKAIDNRNRKIVQENSQRIARLIALNNATEYKKIKNIYSFRKDCTSKRQLERMNVDDYLISLIQSDESFFQRIIDNVIDNRNRYEQYKAAVKLIKTTATEEFCKPLKISLSTFLEFEEKAFNKIMNSLDPQTDVTIHCEIRYTTPAARNVYGRSFDYDFKRLRELFDYAKQVKKESETRQEQIKIERAKMTDSLRYDIMRRDNFRCKLCGSTAEDGVKLHVDHIVPVSKGGLTVKSNLRTLCDRCNLGKRDKME